jgi:DNA invertase Pin-like site-specific DNA recombinase
MKVIVYSRVSTDKQTFEQQERTVKEWLDARNMTITEIISDEGVSGGVTYQKRNLGKKVLPILEHGDILIVSEISRLGRSMSDINKLVNEELKPRGVRLVIVQMGIDLDCANVKAVDEMLLFAFSFAAQMEKELIQQRTKSALEVRKRKLESDGSFISKSGKVCTKLGRPAGGDTTKAAQSAAHARTEQARKDRNNQLIWNTIKTFTNDFQERKNDNFRRASEFLVSIGAKTNTGMDPTADRLKSAYHNLKVIFNNEHYKKIG